MKVKVSLHTLALSYAREIIVYALSSLNPSFFINSENDFASVVLHFVPGGVHGPGVF